MEERRFRAAGVLESVPLACDFVAQAARTAGLDDRAIYHCQIATDEAVTNLIEHGYQSAGQDQVIDIVCQSDNLTFTITILDDGPPFDPLSVPDPNPNAPLAEREPGGWGVFFIKKLMDRVHYDHHAGRNRLVLVKHIVPHTPATSQPPPYQQRITEQQMNHKVWSVTPVGWLDAAQSAALEQHLTQHLNTGHKYLVLNMADVDHIASEGLKRLVGLWQRAREMKGDLILAAVKPRLRETLEIIGLDLVFVIADTPEAAANRFATKSK